MQPYRWFKGVILCYICWNWRETSMIHQRLSESELWQQQGWGKKGKFSPKNAIMWTILVLNQMRHRQGMFRKWLKPKWPHVYQYSPLKLTHYITHPSVMRRHPRAAVNERCLHHARPTSRPGSVLPSVPDSRLEGHSMTSAIGTAAFFSTFLFTEITERVKPKELCVISPKKVMRTIMCTRWDAALHRVKCPEDVCVLTKHKERNLAPPWGHKRWVTPGRRWKILIEILLKTHNFRRPSLFFF